MRFFGTVFFSALFMISNLQAQGPVVLITGASRGIGLATAELLAKSGYSVYATSRNGAERLDVTDLDSIQEIVRRILEKEGRIDILINNAGYALAGPLECLSVEEMQAQMDVNFFGPIRVCQAVLPSMRAQKSGRILNISSEQGSYGLPYGSLYTASKAALESISEALSLEVSPWNICVSIVQPGLVYTDFQVKMGSRECDAYSKVCQQIEDSLTEDRTLAPGQTPEEIALFLKDILESPQTKLRYQTSASAAASVSQFSKDPTGEIYTEWMKPQIPNP